MINSYYKNMLKEKDVIFEIFNISNEKKQALGPENVYDFSLGNPSVPAPDSVKDSIIHNLETLDPLMLHGYSPGFGIPAARQAVASYLNKHFGMNYDFKNIFMTIGAAGALAHAFRAVTNPGDTVMTFAPCFSEYKVYTAGAGLNLSIVPADIDSFQINFQAFEAMLDDKVSAVLINSPNNPSGIVYSTETIKRLAEILKKKSEEFGHTIYLISDEPYRDIVFEGVDAPYIPKYYPHTLSCYSYSKSLSLPGERIGYLAVNPDCDGASTIIEICPQISRTIGQNGAASIMQRTLIDVCGDTSQLEIYEKNAKILYEALSSYGYEMVKPGGTFYMFPRSLEKDSYAFCRRAMDLNLMLVPGDIFSCPGHFRIAYCVPTDQVERSLPVFKKLSEQYK